MHVSPPRPALLLLATCLTCFGLLLTWGGCGGGAKEAVYPDVVTDTLLPSGKAIGVPCATTGECRPGLECGTAGTCEPAGSLVVGQECVVSAECQSNAYCGPTMTCLGDSTYQEDSGCRTDDDCREQFENDKTVKCVPVAQRCYKSGEGAVDDVCDMDGDCGPGLFCERLTGIAGVCAEGGTVDVGGNCDGATDCYPGLLCGPGDKCMGVLQAIAAAKWDGATCEEPLAENPRSFFQVPGADGVLSEFYRLPFPNDIRGALGKVTAGHPRPGRGLLDFDPVARVLDAVDDGLDGFGSTPTVFFRFSTALDFASIDYDAGDGTPANLVYVNVDPASDAYKQGKGYVWGASTGRGKFICSNWLSLRAGGSDLLLPATTYAVLLFKGVRTCGEKDDGGAGCAPNSPDFKADDDFVSMMAASAPADPNLAVAWDKYAKLRQYLADEGIDPSTLLNAAVFTTSDPTKVMTNARAVARKHTPKLSDVTVCQDGMESPCADPEDPRRVCSASSQYWEIQGKISLPIFQKGTPPYLSPQDGGDLSVDDFGNPVIVRTESVCFSLTIPKSEAGMPADGWPVVLYAHGTGGTFRSHVADGTAAVLADSTSSSNGSGAAVLGIDGVAHGPRRGTKLDPETLFFNFANPRGARGNVYQGAIDYFTLVHWIEVHTGGFGQLDAKLDAARLGFMGHSQGAQTGPLFAAFEPALGAVVLSGAGAGLTESVLHKTSPTNIAAGINAAFQEAASGTHPVITLLQQYFDPVDPVNYGWLLTKLPPEAVDPGHNLMVVYGQGDTYTPAQTTRLLVDVLGIGIMAPALDTGAGEAFDGFEKPDDPESDRVLEGPLTNEFFVAGDPLTLGMVQHAPADYDGHFVAFKHALARAQVAGFFSSWFSTGVAVIPIE